MPDTHESSGETDDERLNIGAAAEILDADISTVRRWADTGYLRSSRFGPAGYRRFRRSDVEALRARHESETSADDAPAASTS